MACSHVVDLEWPGELCTDCLTSGDLVTCCGQVIVGYVTCSGQVIVG